MDEIERIRSEYASRRERFQGSDLYSLFNPAQLYTIQQRQRAVLKCLRVNGLYPPTDKYILELGCGAGGVLLEMLSSGVMGCNLHGADLLFDRLQLARQNLTVPLACADGQNLPYASHSFDLVMQFTVFSSVLDDKVRANLAAEMMRVARPNALMLWYDFWLNPTNKQTRGLRPAEIRQLFPNCAIEFHKITLAPPIARRIVPISWGLAFFLESLGVFNTHYLAAIRPLPSNHSPERWP